MPVPRADLALASVSASRAGCISSVWKAPDTATGTALRAPLAVAYGTRGGRAGMLCVRESIVPSTPVDLSQPQRATRK